MAIYVVLYVILLLVNFISFKNNRKLFFFLFVVIGIGMCFVASFRSYNVGTDTSNYLELYTTLAHGQLSRFLEPGWVLINDISRNFFDDYRAVLIISSVLICFLFFYRSYKSTIRPLSAIFFFVTLGFYTNSFNVTRQVLALAFIYFAFPYLLNGELKKFYFFVIVACCFHVSAIVCVLMPVLISNRIHFNTLFVIIGLFLSYFIGVLGLKYFFSLFNFGVYNVYIEGESSGSITRFLMNLMFLCFYFMIRIPQCSKLLMLFFWGVVGYNVFAFNPAASRIAMYFMLSQIFLYSNYVFMKKRYSQIVGLASYLYASSYYFLILTANIGEIIPYELSF